MSKKLFTREEVEELSKNTYVQSVSPKGITYTDAFKELSSRPMLMKSFQRKSSKPLDLG